MGIADWMGRLFGGGTDSDGTPRRRGGREDAALERIWRVQQALGNKMRLETRDELLRRKRPLPFAEMPAFWGPTVAGIDELLNDEGFDTYLERLDPFVRAEPLVMVAGVEALVPCGEGQVVRLRFPAWHPNPGPGPDPGDATVVETVILDGSLTEPRTIGSLTLTPREDAAQVLDVTDDEEELHVIIGVGIPLAAICEEPSYLIGSFGGPISTEDITGLEEAGYTGQDGCFIEALYVPLAAAGVDAATTSMIAPGLNIPCWATGRGAPVGPPAQPLVAALLANDRDGAAALVADVDTAALADAARFFAVEDALDDAEWLLEQASDDHAGLGNLKAAVASLRGHAVEAATAEGTAEGDEDFVISANHAVAAWADERPEDALEIIQASPLATRSWLGNLIDAVIHQTEVTAGFRISPLRYHLAPVTPAMDLARGGNLEDAERLLRRCLEMEPHHAAAAGTLALLMAGAGRHEECVAHCEAFVARVGTFPYLQAIQADALFALGRTEDAALALRRALETTPDHEAWWTNLAVAMILLGRKDAAMATIEELDDHGGDLQLLQLLRRLS